MRYLLVFAAILAPATWAQQEPPPAKPPSEPAVPGTLPAPEKPPVIENLGKPMVVPVRCTDDDIEWAGLSCTADDPCPVYLEIDASEAVGDRIFAAGNLHTEAVTLYSVLLGSADAGRTWREQYQRVRGAGLDHIQFIDPSTGWISGEMLSPLPRDPFLLLTTDGGETWRQQAVFAEGAFGSIQRFYFSSRTNGSLIVDRGPGESDRYALYESPNGGETWTIKEENSRPMRLKGAGAGPPGWRVRADARTHSYEIEREQAGRWAPVASFAVNAGACKRQ
jgi:hypothetical protein